MIRDIDQSEVISARAIDSPFLGSISVKELSGGVKTLILMQFDTTGRIFNASACEDDCAPWIVKITEGRDLTINLHHIKEALMKALPARKSQCKAPSYAISCAS